MRKQMAQNVGPVLSGESRAQGSGLAAGRRDYFITTR
jgi:hypothetical protein